MTSLADLYAILPPVHALSVDGDRVRILGSDPADPQLENRQALVLEYMWGSNARVIAELEGAYRFLLRDVQDPTADGALRVLTAGGMLSTVNVDGNVSRKEIVPPSEGPMYYGHLCCVLFAAAATYVGGMSRQMYRAAPGDARWERADQGLFDETASSATSAVYGMAATSDGGIIAVGGDGEIWRYREGRWCAIESGTNLMLNAVTRLLDEHYVVCGAGRTIMLVHDDDSVEQVEHDIESNFLFQVFKFRESIFVFAEDGIHRFEFGAKLNYQGMVAQSKGARLFVEGKDSLLVLGSNSIGRTRDGRVWEWLDASSIALQLPR